MKKIILSILGADHYLSPGRGGGEGGGGRGDVGGFWICQERLYAGGRGGGEGGGRGDVGGFWICQERLYAWFVTRRVRYMFATKIPNSLPLLICSHNFSFNH